MSEIICACCHCELTEDTGFWFDEEFYCQDCLDDTTCLCDHCGRRIWNDDNAGNSERPLCDDCYEDYYTTCEECGRIIHCDDAEYDDYENSYCCNCYNDSSIHDYSYKPSPIFYGDGNRYFGVELEIDVGGKSRSNADKLCLFLIQQKRATWKSRSLLILFLNSLPILLKKKDRKSS